MTDRHRIRRKRRSQSELRVLILNAAAREFEANGFAGATTAAIAKRADVTEAQIFRYFESKTVLFRESIFGTLNQHFNEFLPAGTAEGEENEHGLSVRYIDELQQLLAGRSRMILSLVAANIRGSDDLLGTDGIAAMQAYFEKGAENLARRHGAASGTSADYLVRVSFAAVLGNVLFKDLIFSNGQFPDAKIRESLAKFMLNGLSGWWTAPLNAGFSRE